MKKIIVSIIAFSIATILATVIYANQDLIASVSHYNVCINGKEQKFTEPIVTINDKTYIPLREVMETLKMNVNWNANSQSISINDIAYPFEQDGLWGYRDINDNVIVTPKYIEAKGFSEGMALVKNSSGQHGQFGFVDINGNEKIPCTYYMAYSFSNGAALVCLANNTDEDNWTYIDRKGERLFDKTFTLAKSFCEGYAAVLKSGYGFPVPNMNGTVNKWSYIDKRGEFATKLEFEDASNFHNGYAVVKCNGKWGVIDDEFVYTVPCEYDEIGEFGNGFITVKKNDIWQHIDMDGNFVDIVK